MPDRSEAFDYLIFSCKSVRETIFDIIKPFQCSDKTLIMAFMYIDRLIEVNPGYRLHDYNVRGLLLTALLISYKMNHDKTLTGEDFAEIGEVSINDLEFWEELFYDEIGSQLSIDDNEYEEYRSLLK